ncbi:hypothetical protein B7494_g961 [Chlorociboria aeruginascens]|nr:hypothetical protein B7494_g961 [Chlorociboria aeruginascens]
MSFPPPFRPFGLIQTHLQGRLYQRAHIANITNGIANPKENETVALMEALFSQNIFADRNIFVVSSQQPPYPASNRACDITISYLVANLDVSTLCFAECKRTNTRAPYMLAALEDQAMEYCTEHLEHHPDKTFVYAATMAGAHIRLWKCEVGHANLKSMWGNAAKADWTQYKDVGNDQDAQLLEQTFAYMKSVTPDSRADGNDIYGLSPSLAMSTSSSTAPGGWASTNSLYGATSTYYQQPSSFATNVAQGSSSSDPYPGYLPYGTESPNQQQAMVPPSMVLGSSKPTLTTDAVEVRVSYEKHPHRTKPDEYKYFFTYNDNTYMVRDYQWRQETILIDDKLCTVQAYTGKNSGTNLWTQTLDPTALNERQIYCFSSETDDAAVTDPTILPEIGDFIPTAQGRSILMCRDPLDTWKERLEQHPFRLALCVHSWCFSVFRWGSPEWRISDIYRLLRSVIPLPYMWEGISQVSTREYPSLDQVGSLRALLASSDTYPARSPLPLMKLPPEIRFYIWERVGSLSPYSAFTLVLGEASRLIDHLHSPQSRILALKLGSHLSAKTLSVFGIEYLKELTCDESGSRVHGIVTEARFVTSLVGICAIKLVGCDWETSWIGKVPTSGTAWYGVIRGPVDCLSFDFNDLNCAINISSTNSYSPTLCLWDRPDFPTSIDPETALFCYDRDIGGPRSNGPRPPFKRRFFKYLPLYHRQEYINSLTVYTRHGGITGLEAHFGQTSSLLGFRLGCPQHVLFQAKERIAHAWLRILDEDIPCTYQRSLAIQTTLGRRFYFGPFIPPYRVPRDMYKWILKGSGCVSGFYYENPHYASEFESLGIESHDPSQTSPLLPPQYHNCLSWPAIASAHDVYISVAVMRDLKEAYMCRVGDRCTGMLLHYHTRPPTVLGQWHPVDASEHLCIYDGEILDPINIYFEMSPKDKGNRWIVVDIGFAINKTEASHRNLNVFNFETASLPHRLPYMIFC